MTDFRDPVAELGPHEFERVPIRCARCGGIIDSDKRAHVHQIKLRPTGRTRMRCNTCGKFRKAEELNAYTQYGHPTAEEPPDQEIICTMCLDGMSEGDRTLLEATCWIKPHPISPPETSWEPMVWFGVDGPADDVLSGAYGELFYRQTGEGDVHNLLLEVTTGEGESRIVYRSMKGFFRISSEMPSFKIEEQVYRQMLSEILEEIDPCCRSELRAILYSAAWTGITKVSDKLIAGIKAEVEHETH